ncbi:MAG: hypothetical protein V1849_03240 [Chloroflexota bacterium]
MRASYREVFQEDPPKSQTGQASMWNDVNILHEVGIPTVKFGLKPVTTVAFSARGSGVRSEGVNIEEYVRMAQIYALTALQICGGR